MIKTTNRLIPNAITVANSLKNTKFASSGSYRMKGKSVTLYNNPLIDAINFIASIYAKELNVANSNSIWDFKLVNGNNQLAPFSPDQGNHYLNLTGIVAISEEEWNELQVTISKVHNIIYPFYSSYYSIYTVEFTDQMFDKMGVLSGGATATLALNDANGNPILGSPFNQGSDYAVAWNTLKVPTDAALGVVTPYLVPIFKPSNDTNYLYRYTGIRRWFNFTGYDS